MVRHRYRHWIFRLPVLRRYRAICLGRTIYFKEGAEALSPRLLRHEETHQDQIQRHGLIRFYTLYIFDYMRNLVHYREHDRAYREIRFEREAFLKEGEAAANEVLK